MADRDDRPSRADTDSVASSGADPDAGSGADPDASSGADPDAGSGADPDASSGADSDASSGADSDADPPVVGSSEWFGLISARGREMDERSAIEAMAAGRRADLHRRCALCFGMRLDAPGDFRTCAVGAPEEVEAILPPDPRAGVGDGAVVLWPRAMWAFYHWACVNGNSAAAELIRDRLGRGVGDYMTACGALERGYIAVADWVVATSGLERAYLAKYISEKWAREALPPETQEWLSAAD